MTDPNKLKLYKLTKPDTFSLSYSDSYKEYSEWLNNNQQRIPRKSHKWHANLTDYFNYGFNEHTMQIYVHKITQLTELYRKHRLQYADKCEKIEGTLFNSAKEIKKMTKDSYPLDLGGLFIPVDEKMVDYGFKFQVENLYEQYNNQSSNDQQLQNQYHCTGEALLYKSKFMSEIHNKQVKYIQDLYKQQKKENQKDLYLFNQAIKIFPITKDDEMSIFSRLASYSQFIQQLEEKKPTIRERSRSPKQKKSKKH